jgi:capsular exopolysaccharide synthesis family protein
VETATEKELTLQDLFSIFRRRQKIVYGTLLIFVVLGAFYCVISTRRYASSGTIQVQKQGSDAMGLESMMTGAADSASDALGANINLQTQANILQSDSLALRTIKDLNLESTKDFKPRWNPIGMALGWISPRGHADPANADLDHAPQRRLRVLKTFHKNLQVKPVGGTRLIEISYLSSDPNVAAAVVNKLSQALIDYSFRTRYDATQQASQWLSGQLGDLRQESENLQAKVVNLQKETGVYSLGMSDGQGHEQAYSGVLDQLQQTTTASNMAKQNVILKGAIARAAEAGDAETLSGLAGNSVGGQSQAVTNSMALIQNLRQQQATQTASLQELQSKYGASYPRVIELRGSLAGLDRSIHQEIDRVKKRAESDYKIAQQTAAGSQQQYQQAKQQADKINDKAIEYAIVRQEAEESRGLYEDLTKRLRAAGVLEGLKPSDVTVVDPGRVPAKPTKPNVPLYLAIAAGGGFFLGCCGALLTDTLDNKISSVDDLEQLTGQTILGALPFVKDEEGKNHVVAMTSPQSPYAEAIRAVRTSILLWQSSTPPKVILVTSSLEHEGKSTFSANLAVLLAQHGHRVLLVDADLRRGMQYKRFAVKQRPGLSEMLTGQIDSSTVSSPKDIPNLSVLTAGTVPPNPSELLGSQAMQACVQVWQTQYDFVIFDGAPVLPVTDSVSLHALTDATLLLVRSGVAEKAHVKRSYRMLARNNHLLGVVMNALQANDSSYYGYYGYKKYGYNYKENADA